MGTEKIAPVEMYHFNRSVKSYLLFVIRKKIAVNFEHGNE